jgi:HK97 family phage prohead protease
MEKRTYKSSDLAIEKRDDGIPVIRGHAAVFDVVESGGWFREKVAPGAFRDSLQEDDIRALWNHDSRYVLGRNRANTLKLWEDERGLAVEITPPDTQQARDFMESIRRGDVTQMSFGFQVKESTWVEEKDQDDLRVLNDIKLWEVSPVTFPFYKDTDVSIKAEHRAWKDSAKPKNRWKYNNKQRRYELFAKLGVEK